MKRSFLLLLASIGLLVSCGSESSPTQSGDSSSSQAGGSSSSTLVSGTSSGSSTTEGAFSALAIKDSAGSYWISGTASSPDGFSSIVGEVQHGGKVLDAKYFSVKVGTKLSDYARFGYDSKNVPLSGPKSIEMKLHEGDASLETCAAVYQVVLTAITPAGVTHRGSVPFDWTTFGDSKAANCIQ